MLNKSFRPSKEDARRIKWLISHDTRVEKTAGEALYYAYKESAAHLPDWRSVSQMQFYDLPDDIDALEFGGGIISFSVDEKDYSTVATSIRDQLNIERIRVSFMTRLCILAQVHRIIGADEKKQIVIENIDAADLLVRVNHKTLDFIKSGTIEPIMTYLSLEE